MTEILSIQNFPYYTRKISPSAIVQTYQKLSRISLQLQTLLENIRDEDITWG